MPDFTLTLMTIAWIATVIAATMAGHRPTPVRVIFACWFFVVAMALQIAAI